MLSIRAVCSLISAALLMVNHVWADDPSSSPGCSPYTEEVFMESGSTIELYCISDKVKTGRPMVFLRDGQPVAKEFDVKVINTTTSRLTVPNLLISARYTCQISNKDVCSTLVQIGRKPAPVRDFDCISHNWEVLNCSWSTNPIGDTRYKIQYFLPIRGSSGYSYSCPNNDDVTMNRCVWTVSSNPPYRRPHRNFHFILTGHNSWGEITQKIAFNHYDKLLPSPVKKLKALNVTFDSVILNWSIGIFCFFDDGIDYRIEQKEVSEVNGSSDDKVPWVKCSHNMEGVKSGRINDEVTFKVKKLTPNTSYKFRVSFKVRNANDSFWSKPEIVDVKTLPKL